MAHTRSYLETDDRIVKRHDLQNITQGNFPRRIHRVPSQRSTTNNNRIRPSIKVLRDMILLVHLARLLQHLRIRVQQDVRNPVSDSHFLGTDLFAADVKRGKGVAYRVGEGRING